MEENQQLLQPLMYPPSATVTTTTTTPRGHHDIKADESILSIFFRLVLVTFIGIVSIWANHEASKGFAITIVNEAGADTFPAKRFSLFYLSNDEATRIVIKASKSVENFLYPIDMYNKKKVNQVTLKLADRNLSDGVVVEFGKEGEFVLHLSPSIMEDQNFKHAMLLEVKKCVARIWLWDGQGNAPHNLINGIVEYIASNFSASSPIKAKLLSSTTAYWKHNDIRVVTEFLNYCECSRPGFIRRLNQAMKDGWHERKLDNALGMPVQNLCTTYNSSKHKFSSTLDY
ncbi:Plant basic secretory protein (BSP) family protein [Abeliophyllum distichum]|uniref:Plant basic secretory protein (BSP) family protein n=1 Tax=Abeliophyllum distichum TaxID=126358 RepID=A0ABD1QK54_9LAMI